MTNETNPPESRYDAKTFSLTFIDGDIAAKVQETRLLEGGHRYGVCFHRATGDLSLDSSFCISLGEDELMHLMGTAMQAIYAIRRYRADPASRPTARFDGLAFQDLTEADGWDNDHAEGVPPWQIENLDLFQND